MRTTSRRLGIPATGFAYLGLLIFVAIAGVISAAAVSFGSIAQRRIAEDELLFVGLQFRAALKSYYEATPPGGDPYPLSLQALLKDSRFPTVVRHLRQIYVDPLTGKTDWLLVTTPTGEIMGISSASDQHPIKVDRFPPPFEIFAGKKRYSEWVFYYQISAVAAARPSAASGP
ncbi:type II secretion system protein [Burkholderia ambifaria]|uniref:type II secretion system protein n=1 Tax=Burkholderia ambifaria TaxID=152480 RepID=UPI00158C0654|nr:type II secretion system protein [Burkholderia ambifaria]MBR8177464.1 type II secretion system protein [Burkholderia ambifaria]